MTDFNYKSLTKEELIEIYAGTKFKIDPMWHQLVSLTFTLGEDLNRVAYLHGVGTGKTLCSLITAEQWKTKKTLVIAPHSSWGSWIKDIGKMKQTYTLIEGTAKERTAALKQKKDFYIIRYESLKTIYSSLKKVKQKFSSVAKKQWKIDQTSFVHGFDCIILDEIHKCKNYAALQSEICYILSSKARHCIGLSGTPVDKNMLELFNIYKTIDLGDSLGLNFWYFRGTHFEKQRFDWEIKPGHDTLILDQLSGHTISFSRDECFDLPELSTVERPILPSKEFLDLQHKIIHEDEIEIEGTIVDISSNSVKSQKLSQLSSGFLYYTEEGIQKAYRLTENPKVEALIDLVEDSESKIIVVHKYTEEALLIEEALKKEKIVFMSVRGSSKIDKSQIETEFKKPEIKVLILHTNCSEGFNATISNTIVFFSPIASPKIREQCEGRILRNEQKSKCIAIDFVLEKSMDSLTNKNRTERKTLVDTVMEYIRGYK